MVLVLSYALQGVVSKTCHVANAERGETGQIDKAGAARRRSRGPGHCLFVLSEGGGRAFLLTEGGVWLAQIPTDQTRNDGGDVIRRKRKRERHPNGQIIMAWSDHDPKIRHRLSRDGAWAIRTGRSGRGVLGGSRPAGWNLAPGHVPKVRDLPNLLNVR
jgi:hypothetical protein